MIATIQEVCRRIWTLNVRQLSKYVSLYHLGFYLQYSYREERIHES